MLTSRSILRLHRRPCCLRGASRLRVPLSHPMECLGGVGSGVLRAGGRGGVLVVLRRVHLCRCLVGSGVRGDL